jgi:hypothetical protein
MKKVFLVSLLIIGPLLIQSCCWDCDCKWAKDPVTYTIKGMVMKAIIRNRVPETLASRSTRASGLEFLFEISTNESNLPTSTPASFGRPACPAPKQSREKIESYSITANNTLVSDLGTFNPGEDLKSLFTFSDGGPGQSFHSLAFSLFPQFKTKQAAQQIFTFSFTFDDGRSFEYKSSTFELLVE